jgi:hypothetical protein
LLPAVSAVVRFLKNAKTILYVPTSKKLRRQF